MPRTLHVKIRDGSGDVIHWMAALSDEARIRVLRLVERQELSVAELCDVLQANQSKVSRHLKVLADNGFVQSRGVGTAHLYRMRLDEIDPAARRLWIVAREQTDIRPWARQDELRLESVLHARETDAQTFFAGAAGEWDRLRGELYGEKFGIEAMLSLLPADWIVADLACGTGHIALALAAHVRTVIGIDNSPAMLKAANRRTESFKNVDLRRGELNALPIEAGSCDAAMMILGLTYAQTPQQAIDEMARIIKPGGRAILVDLLPHGRDDFRRQLGQRWAGFEPSDIARMFETAGLSNANIHPIEPEADTKGPAMFIAVAARRCVAANDEL